MKREPRTVELQRCAKCGWLAPVSRLAPALFPPQLSGAMECINEEDCIGRRLTRRQRVPLAGLMSRWQ